MSSIVFHRKKLSSGPKKPRKKIHWQSLGAKVFKWFLIIAIPAIIGTGVYLVLFSPLLTIDFIDVQNDPGVDASRVRSLIFDQMDQTYLRFLPQKNILFFDEEAAKQRVWDAYALDKLVIEKQYPKTLSVTVVGSPLAVAWLSAGKWYHIDGKGEAVREIDGATLPPLAKQLQENKPIADIIKSSKDPQKDSDKKPSEPVAQAAGPITAGDTSQPTDSVIPIVVNAANEEVQIGSSLMTGEKVAFIIALREKLKSIGISLLYVKTASGASADLDAITQEGWELMLNTDDDLVKQVKKTDIVLKERIKDQRKTLQYVDVRFDNRVYYK